MSAKCSIPTTQLELSISCRNLANLDTFSKSDPCCIVYIKNPSDREYRHIGKTETITDDLNPHFVKKFLINYNFEVVQKLKFELWDIDPVSNDFIGSHETSVAQVVAFRGKEYCGELRNNSGKKTGQLVVVAEEVSDCKKRVTFGFKGHDILGSSWFFKPKTFLTIWRTNEDGTYTLVHRTEVYTASHNPCWNKIDITSRVLCNGDFDRNIRISCMKYKFSGNHQEIGSVFTTLNDIINRSQDESQRKFELSLKGKSSKGLGQLDLAFFLIESENTFFDYIKGGTELHFAVAIDFTASNGDPRYPDSLHYIGPEKPNQYEMALRAIGEILKPYNKNNVYPAFGFGAKLGEKEPVSHQFPLNGNHSHPYCNGMEELIQHYRSTLQRVFFYGPTNFAPVIKSTTNIARQYLNGQSYFILLIITDGIICDMPQTKKAIVDASYFPVSIIIVGVGNDDFAAMEDLDSDDRLLEADGKQAERDIVQFVPLRKFIKSDGIWLHSMGDLAQEVLYEVPDQLVSYMRQHNIKPLTSPSLSA